MVGRQNKNAHIADCLHIWDVASANIFWLSVYAVRQLAPPGKYD